MAAKRHTEHQLEWFAKRGIHQLDLGVRRIPTGVFICKDSANLDTEGIARCLPWARYENTNEQADVYIRPARYNDSGDGYTWPLVFLDDVSPPMAQRIARKYATLVTHTSKAGGCHVWIATSRPIAEAEREAAQRYLIPLAKADPGSVSGEHWSRLAGTKNWKRGGQDWCNVIAASDGQPWEPSFSAPEARPAEPPSRSQGGRVVQLEDRDESVAEFAWCCHELRRGINPAQIEQELTERARIRHKANPARYAKRTVEKAQRCVW